MQWILVTGGAKRLGAAVCLKLAEQGHAVAIHYHTSKHEALHVAEKCRRLGAQAEVIQGDFSSQAAVESFIQAYLTRFPDTKGLVNNVGNYLIKSTLNTSITEWLALLQTNLTAPFCLIKALAPSIQQTAGSIVNIGKVGLALGSAHSSCYNLTKASLWNLTKNLARELAPSCVRVNMVSPGYLDDSVDMPPLEKLPMKRPGHHAEVAHVVAFLMQPESSYITGQNIEVAGGLHV